LARLVADTVADQLRDENPADRRATREVPRSVEAAALDLYIKGRYWWNTRGPGLQRSIEFFKAALDADPTFALAWSGRADAYVQLGYASLLRPDDAFPKARAAAEQALALDSTLAEPHATLGFVRLYYDWDWPGAEREFRRALSLNPSSATAHEWYGLFLAAMGRFEEAMEHERLAQKLDPLSTAIGATAAWVLYYAGRNDEAARALRVVLREDSSFALGHFYLGRVHQARGQPDSALAEYRATGPLLNWVPTVAAVGHVYGTQGLRQEALAALAGMYSRPQDEYVSAYAVALVHAALGQPDSAFAWLDRGVEERTHWMVWLRRDPRWTSIRSDPRFDALARRLRIPS
jgi:tetratricopeptide (TPR) repeat protein